VTNQSKTRRAGGAAGLMVHVGLLANDHQNSPSDRKPQAKDFRAGTKRDDVLCELIDLFAKGGDDDRSTAF
jgi:hypothetical protein